MADLELSIVIPSQRRTDLLTLCLESVTRFAPPGVQVIVVDDASRWNIVSKTAAQFANIDVVRLERSTGFCAAANAGIAAARGEIVELLNDDAEVTADWWVSPLATFADGRIAAVAPLVLKNQPGPVRIDSAGDHYDSGGFATKRFHDSPLLALRACEVSSVSACAAFYRRSALIEAGGFPEEFGGYFDDVDLACRLRRLGYILAFEPASVVWHRVSATYGRTPTRRLVERQSRNEEWLYWRNSASWRTAPRHAAVLMGKLLRRIEEGTVGPWLAGRLRAASVRRLSLTATGRSDETKGPTHTQCSNQPDGTVGPFVNYRASACG